MVCRRYFHIADTFSGASVIVQTESRESSLLELYAEVQPILCKDTKRLLHFVHQALAMSWQMPKLANEKSYYLHFSNVNPWLNFVGRRRRRPEVQGDI